MSHHRPSPKNQPLSIRAPEQHEPPHLSRATSRKSSTPTTHRLSAQERAPAEKTPARIHSHSLRRTYASDRSTRLQDTDHGRRGTVPTILRKNASHLTCCPRYRKPTPSCRLETRSKLHP